MLDHFSPLMIRSAVALGQAFYGLLIPASVFIFLAALVKGRKIIHDTRKALPETRVTLFLMAFNVVVAAPLIAIFSTWMTGLFAANGIKLVDSYIWDWIPVPVVAGAAIFAGDFIGYWRHRLEHTPLLWPSHAIHHSDTEMTWLALERFHPINRFTTVIIDNAVLILLGFPAYAIIANNLVRHYYGYYIHADLPWTYGKLGKIFVSPAMHRWHHAADRAAYDTNYATVFSLFDYWFGTYRVPGICRVPLGVTDDMGNGAAGQLAYPFRLSSYRLLKRWLSKKVAFKLPPKDV